MCIRDRLSIMAGGSGADVDRARPVFEVLGKCTRIGPVGSGQLAKLANQASVGITTACYTHWTLPTIHSVLIWLGSVH